MSDDLITDDSSHYEISLTAGQAFIAFVLLLFSLAAAFAFGLILGRGQADGDRLIVRREPSVISEGSAPAEATRIVELDEARTPDSADPSHEVPVILNDGPGDAAAPEPAAPDLTPPVSSTVPAEQPPAQRPSEADPSGPVFAQVLSSTDVRAAENLAARLIENDFNTAYVERVSTANGMIYRVRVRFATEAEARGSVERLRALTRSEPWITRQ